jgi:hypothetical protein
LPSPVAEKENYSRDRDHDGIMHVHTHGHAEATQKSGGSVTKWPVRAHVRAGAWATLLADILRFR